MATTKRQTTTYLDPVSYRWAEAQAKAQGRTISQFLARLILEAARESHHRRSIPSPADAGLI
jgi:hypothetical protein